MNTRPFAFCALIGAALSIACTATPAPTAAAPATEETSHRLYLDVHRLGPGNVTLAAVAEAHEKDLATQDDFGVDFSRYWVDEEKGTIYCLSEAPSAESVSAAHEAAHGLVPDDVIEVVAGDAVPGTGERQMFLDVHRLEPGSVTAEDVAGAHEKDLAVQADFDVSFLEYWVDAASGTVVCLSEAPNAEAVKAAHGAAHGLLPEEVFTVHQGH